MSQSVDARIVDVNGFGNNDDGVIVREGGMAAWGGAQVKQLDGNSYITSWFIAAVAAQGVRDIRIVTAVARKVIFHINSRTSGIRMRIYENPTATGGTLLAAVPPNFGTNLNVNFAWHTPVVTNVGILHFDCLGDRSVGDTIFTFQPSSGGFSYLVRLTNLAAAANDIAVNLETFV